MSGGSFEYLYRQEVGDLSASHWQSSHVELVERMQKRLQRTGYEEAAADTQTVLDMFAQIQALETKLADVWHAVEWVEDCDWGEGQLIEAHDQYKQTKELDT